MKRSISAGLLAAAIILGWLMAGCGDRTSTSALPQPAGQTRPAQQLIYEDETMHIYQTVTAEGRPAYAAQIRARARSGQFQILLELDSHLRITDVSVPSYLGDRGRAITRPTFTRQFIGKHPASPLTLGSDINAVSGATLSAKAMADQVRRVIEQLEAVQRQNN